jgi:hypothetical protein
MAAEQGVVIAGGCPCMIITGRTPEATSRSKYRSGNRHGMPYLIYLFFFFLSLILFRQHIDNHKRDMG